MLKHSAILFTCYQACCSLKCCAEIDLKGHNTTDLLGKLIFNQYLNDLEFILVLYICDDFVKENIH